MDATPQTADYNPQVVWRARVAVNFCFFELGALIGVWAVHIPVVQGRLGIDPGVLGIALFTLAVGAVVTMPLTGLALAHFGSRLPTAVLALAFPIAAPWGVLSQSTPMLFVSLFVFGATMGGLDVAMNTQATEVEAARGKPTMSSFHGLFSVGALCGALLGGLMVSAGWGNGSGAALAATVSALVAIWAAMNLLPSAKPVAQGPRFTLPNRAVLGLGLIAFLAFAGEGVVTDWSALYLATIKHSTEATAGFGFAAFSIVMTVCRIFGDAMVARLGAVPTILGGGILMAAGMVIAILAPSPWLSAIGFAVVALGTANLVPVVFSAAARTPGVPAGPAVAAVTTLAYSGFLVFPPIIGFVAKSFGLSAALAIVVAMALAIASLAGQVRR